MARSEARLSVSIWTDPDFKGLTPTAQRMFMFLLSQPDLAHDGVIALRERRWSTAAAGLAVDAVRRDLDELRAARFVVIDDDAEELLIRSFIRRDKVYRQPNVLRAAADHLEVVTSPYILTALAAELRRVAEADDISEGSASIIAEMLAAIEKACPNPPDTPTPNPSGNPSDMPTPGTPGERGVVTVVPQGVSPYPVLRTPSPVPPLTEPAMLDVEIVDPPPNLPAVVEINGGTVNREWIDFCTSRGVKLTTRTIKRYGAAIKAALDQGFTPDLIKRALAQMLADNEAARPSLFDQYLVRAQTGKPKGPGRMTPGERSQHALVGGEDGEAVRALLVDMLHPVEEAS